jgi:Tol biopolymer transport system component
MRIVAVLLSTVVAISCVPSAVAPTGTVRPTVSGAAPIATSPSVSSAPPPAGVLEFHAPPQLTGDWVFAIKAGNGVTSSRVPTGELWAMPLAGGAASLVARYIDWNDGSELRANLLRRQVSADGRRMVLSAASTAGRSVLSLIDFGSQRIATIAHDATADLIRPAISPDGSKVAYVRKVGDRDDGLWLANSDGSAPRQLRPGISGHFTWTYGWTPDSKMLAFDQVETRPSYVLIDIATGARTNPLGFGQVLWGEQASWRAKRPSLAAGLADRDFDGEYRIFVADDATTAKRILATESNHNLILDSPRWNPASDEILYRRLITVMRSEYFVIAATGGVPQRIPLAKQAWSVDWTPDGSGLVYIAQDTGGFSWLGVGVRTAKRDGSGDRELLAMPDGALSDVLAVAYR